MEASVGIRTWWRSRRRRREALGLPPRQRRRRRVCRPCLLFLLLLQMEEDPMCAGLLVDGSRLLGVEMVVALWPTTMRMTTRRVTSCPPCRNSLITTKRLRRPPVGTLTRNRFTPMRRRRRKISRMVLPSLPTFRITTLTLILISTTTTTERTPARSVQCCSRLRRLLRPPRAPDTRLLVRIRTRTRSSPLLTTCPEPSPFLPSLRELPPPSPCRIMHDDNLPPGSSRPRVESLAGWGWEWGWGFRRRRVGRTRIGKRSMRKGGWRVRSS